METEESKELTFAQEETIKKTLEEIRKQDPKKNKRVYPIVVFGDEYDDKDVYIPCSCMACPQNWSISLVPAKPRSQISRSLASKG